MDPMMAMLQGMLSSSGLALDSPRNTRDVALLGDCDEGCAKLVDMLGWKVSESHVLSQCKLNVEAYLPFSYTVSLTH